MSVSNDNFIMWLIEQQFTYRHFNFTEFLFFPTKAKVKMSQSDLSLRTTKVLSPNRASTLSTTSSRSQQDNVKKIAITADGKLPLLRGIDQVCKQLLGSNEI